VIDIPAGDAVGATLSGTYRAVSVVEESCSICPDSEGPDGHCDPPVLYPDERVIISQIDGRVTVEGDGQTGLTGGAFGDGTFRVGTVTYLTNNETGEAMGRVLVLYEGTLVGSRIVGTIRMRFTFDGPTGKADGEQVLSVVWERVTE